MNFDSSKYKIESYKIAMSGPDFILYSNNECYRDEDDYTDGIIYFLLGTNNWIENHSYADPVYYLTNLDQALIMVEEHLPYLEDQIPGQEHLYVYVIMDDEYRTFEMDVA